MGRTRGLELDCEQKKMDCFSFHRVKWVNTMMHVPHAQSLTISVGVEICSSLPFLIDWLVERLGDCAALSEGDDGSYSVVAVWCAGQPRAGVESSCLPQDGG